jgi:hypothetical protein
MGKPRDDGCFVCALGDAGGEVHFLSVLANSGRDPAAGNAGVHLRGMVDGQTTS